MNSIPVTERKDKREADEQSLVQRVTSQHTKKTSQRGREVLMEFLINSIQDEMIRSGNDLW